MNTKKFTLKKGEEITSNGELLRLNHPLYFVAQKIGEAAPKVADIKGSPASDQLPAIDKKTVVAVVKKRLEKLERKEAAVLLPDPEWDEEISTNDHMMLAHTIMQFKSLLKDIEAI